MAFIEKYLPISKQAYFSFFLSGTASLDESLTPGFDFILDRIKFNLSVVHVSDVSFTCRVINHVSAIYNYDLISADMVGIASVSAIIDPARYFFASDTLYFEMILSSANVYGLEVNGWAITSPY